MEAEPFATKDAGLGDFDLKKLDQNTDATERSGDQRAQLEPCSQDEPLGVEMAEKQRDKWDSKADFMLSIIGYCVGLGNVWRFPYLCYQNGGVNSKTMTKMKIAPLSAPHSAPACGAECGAESGAMYLLIATFLIPYFLMLALCGIPLMMCEFALGQYLSLASPSAFKTLSRFTRGVGLAQALSAFLVAIYYNVIICWAVVYLVSSFASDVPWRDCDASWATEHCGTIEQRRANNILGNVSNCTNQTTAMWMNSSTVANCTSQPVKFVASSLEYYNNHILGKTDSIDDPGEFKWKICLSLLFCWAVVFLCLMKGVKSSGKAVWVTATMPYVVLTILLIRGVTLDGAEIGIKYYLTPHWGKLVDVKVWVAAASQIFYSLGIGYGTVLVYGSYNKFNNNCIFDSIIVSCINCGTSFFAGFVVFSVLGFMAHQLNVDVDKVATSGPGLAFNVYPEAISRLPISPLWAILFFFMVFTLGLDSQFGTMECVISGIVDEYGGQFKKHSSIFTAILCISGFILGLPICTGAGVYIVNLLDTQSGGVSLILLALFEIFAIAWIYGAARLADNIETMTGRQPPLYFTICWKFVTPLLLFVILLSTMIQWEGVSLDGYQYPAWAEALGWLVAVTCVVLIPGCAIYEVYKADGQTFKEKVKNALAPDYKRIAQIENQKLNDLHGQHML